MKLETLTQGRDVTMDLSSRGLGDTRPVVAGLILNDISSNVASHPSHNIITNNNHSSNSSSNNNNLGHARDTGVTWDRETSPGRGESLRGGRGHVTAARVTGPRPGCAPCVTGGLPRECECPWCESRV